MKIMLYNPLSMACLIVTVRDLHHDLTQKMTEKDWNEKYGTDLRVLSAVRQGKLTYNASPYENSPIARSIQNPLKDSYIGTGFRGQYIMNFPGHISSGR